VRTTTPRVKKPTTPLPPPRVRKEPPTVEEAVLAAQGLTEDLDQQVAIAAGLMDLPEDEVRPLVAKMVRPRSSTEKMIQTSRGTARVVVVERKNRFSEVTPRRLAAPRVPLTLR